MGDNKLIALLEHLEKSGAGEYHDISGVMLQYYPANNEEEISNRRIFLNLLNTSEMIFYSEARHEGRAALRVKGFEYLQVRRNQEIQDSVSKSVVATNNETVTAAGKQIEILRHQTLIFWVTVAMAAASAFIATIGLVQDGAKERLERKIESLEKRIEQIQSTPQQTMISAPPAIEANDTSKQPNS